MTNFVTYQIELNADNAAKIDAINRIILGEIYTATTETPTAKPKLEVKADVVEANQSMSFTDFKAHAKKAKAAHGEDFALQVIVDRGIDSKGSLAKTLSAVEQYQYDRIVELWEQGKPEVVETDDWGDEPQTAAGTDVDPEAVKTALKAYAQEHGRDEAKAIMTKHGADVLSKVDTLSQKKLAAMLAELV